MVLDKKQQHKREYSYKLLHTIKCQIFLFVTERLLRSGEWLCPMELAIISPVQIIVNNYFKNAKLMFL